MSGKGRRRPAHRRNLREAGTLDQRSDDYRQDAARPKALSGDIDDFAFEGTPINETLIRDLATGNFLEHQRNCVLVGGTGTGKTHLAIAIARACIRDGARGRFFNVIDLFNKLEAEARAERLLYAKIRSRQGRAAAVRCSAEVQDALSPGAA